MSGRAWHAMETAEVLAVLGVRDGEGLDSGEARRRLGVAGPNVLRERPPDPWWHLLLAQFQDFMVLVLLVAAGVSWAMGERADAYTIIAIVVLNALLGFAQEYRAEEALAALRQLAAPVARVRRDGRVQPVPAAEVVPGDVLVLEAGDRVPADARLLRAHALAVTEAALTGESVPVAKDARWRGPAETPLGDRRNMVYMGTVVTRGRGDAVVVATGMETEVGRIAGLIQEAEEGPTPLQRRLAQLGRWLVAVSVALCSVVVLAGALRGEPFARMFLTGVSLAVAAIPEGLPAIVTVALAVGVQRMIRRRAIVRRLQAVETLGCATAILSDKTGTLTRNEMMVRAVWAGGRLYEVTGDGYRPEGEFLLEGRRADPEGHPALLRTLAGGALCTNAVLLPPRAGGRGRPGRDGRRGWSIQGDPTEGALLVAAAKAGRDPARLRAAWETLAEAPFTPERRRMSVVVRDRAGGDLSLYLKGAPDTVLARCTRILGADGRERPLAESDRRVVAATADRLAAQALRVLAVALRQVPPQLARQPDALGEAADALEEDLTFAGLVGMIDPPRPEVRRAVAAASRAGIRTVMITGDHPATARAVACELGIARAGDPVLTGSDLDRLTDRELEEAAGRVRVFARVSPAHKLRIVRAFRARGEVVAMTGDGVNDAPAVKEADIGIAMGLSGTDVTREASQLVLADDNYATIVAAVEEGRGIYDNIRKFIRYLLSCNTGEVLTMFLAAVSRLPLPLLPIQILWVNLVTDGLPALALGVDPPDPDVMRRPPRPPDEGVFARGLGRRILTRGLVIGLSTLGLFVWGLRTGDVTRARTLAFTGLVLAQLVHVFDCRSETRSIWEVGWYSNPWLVAAVASSLLLLLASVYWPPLAVVMETAPLALRDWAVVAAVAGAPQALLVLRALAPVRGIPYLPTSSTR
ncbi:cation-translocating P-type ATPase [Caldinitratiruptor microaerophilus]|uniref:P-type Ca(2+) transporter n=1 Tax=Caldinitratiruptor microaerophilus TaxID=671077 RepID=A0AA35CNM1_9FIRM|nr:cation-translocating P-type ATPase [Caldinitratiruptor microaerophilus]BDG60671.1 ATPase [Caldinitratiruptor microaerophilus]